MEWYKGILIFCLLGFLFSCGTEEECPGCNLNPKIKLEFEPTGTKEYTATLVAEINEKIVLFEDSLDTELTDEVRANIQAKLDTLHADSILFNYDYSLFKVGKIEMGRIDAVNSLDGFEQFQDSIIRDFAIPVDMHQDTSTYYFTYHGLVDTLQILYQRDVTQTFDGVRMRLSEIEVNEELSTFDSIRVKCYSANCGNNLTTIYVYF